MNLIDNYENNHNYNNNDSFELISVTSHSSPSSLPSSSSSSTSTTLSSLVRSSASTTGVECTVIPSLKDFEQFYASFHAYLACIICLFGTGTNLLNAIVLTQKQMHNPTNTLLTGIAIVDSLKMLGYGLQVIYLHFITSPYPDKYPHSQLAVYLILIHHMISIGSHTISTCLLVQLAVYRCWILYSNKLKDVLKLRGRSMRRLLMISSKKRFIIYCYISAGVLGSVLCLPTFIIYQCELIHTTTPLEGGYYNDDKNHSLNVSHNNNNNTGSDVTESQQLFYWFKLRNTSGQTLERVHFILYGCFVKILASILIVIFTIFILIVLHDARKRYKKLQQLPIEIHIDNINHNSNNNTNTKNNNGDHTGMMVMTKDISKYHSAHLQVNIENTLTPDQKSINNNNSNANNEVNNHLGVHRPYQHQLKPNQSILSLTISENPIGVLQTSGLDISHNDYVRKLQSNNNNMSTKNKQQAVTTKSLSNRLRKKAREGQRVTIMLIIVVISFVITEAPQGVFNTLVAIKGECFLSTVYVPLGDILDLLVLLNSSINFILYCAMSQKFRVNFVNLLKKMMSMCCRLWCFQCHQLQRQHHRHYPNNTEYSHDKANSDNDYPVITSNKNGIKE